MNKRPFTGALLVSDMDGTLLNQNDEVSEENKKALERFVEGGGFFTVATGRTAKGVERFYEKLPINLPVIVNNGAQIFDFKNKKVLWKSCLEEDAMVVLDNIIHQFPQLGIEIFCEDGVHIVNKNDVTEWHRLKEQILPGVKNILEVPKPWYKIVLAWENDLLKDVDVYLQGKTGSSRTVFSEAVFLDLLNINTSKGHALEELKRISGIQFKKVIAIGDNLNDLEMIQTADIGIAVENANLELKRNATFCVSHHNNHSVAEVIKYIEENA